MAKLNPHAAPKDPTADLRRRLVKLEEEVKRLRSSATMLENATIGRGGLIVKGSGGLRLVTDGGVVQFEAFGDAGNPAPDGSPQPVVKVMREDGSVAFSLEDPLPGTDGYRQILRLWDRAGNEIFAEDATSGTGIANPWIPFAMAPSRYTDWPKSTSGSFETIWQGQMSVKNPTATLGASYTSDASDTSGSIRYQVNGTTIGSTLSIGFQVATNYLAQRTPWPSGVKINDTVTVTLQVQRSAGTGNVMAAPFLTTGSQSA